METSKIWHSLWRHPLFFCLPLLIGLTFLTGCDRYKLESDSRMAAVSYFYGENGQRGYMLFTWEDILREEKTRQKRNSLGLGEEWEYWDEQISVISLGDLDYFINYSLSFRNSKTGEIYTKEEKYFSVDENHWDPIPLMHEYFKSDPVTGEYRSIKTETF